MAAADNSQSDQEMEKAKEPINLLLVGRTGNGISATFSSIGGSAKTASEGGFATHTNLLEEDTICFENCEVRVVAIPGLCHTNVEKQTWIRQFYDCIEDAFKRIDGQAFQAIVFILSYMHRAGDEEKFVYNTIQNVLGKNALKNSGVLVMTHGDTFNYDYQHTLQFEKWIQLQKKFLRDLPKECIARCVLFDNVTTNETTKREQINSLLSKVDKTTPYTLKDFINGCLYRKGVLENIYRQPKSSNSTSSVTPMGSEATSSSCHSTTDDQRPGDSSVDNEYHVLVIGLTGHEISANVNSIFGHTQIEATPHSMPSNTDHIVVRGRILKLFEIPGSAVSSRNDQASSYSMEQALADALYKCPGGFDAVVLVCASGTVFTEEMKEGIQELSEIYAFKSHGILLMPQADKGIGQEFDWISQTFNDRLILFDNVTNDEAAQMQQRNKLMSKIEEIQNTNGKIHIPLLDSKDNSEQLIHANLDRLSTCSNNRELCDCKTDLNDAMDLLMKKKKASIHNEYSIRFYAVLNEMTMANIEIKQKALERIVSDLGREKKEEEESSTYKKMYCNVINVKNKFLNMIQSPFI